MNDRNLPIDRLREATAAGSALLAVAPAGERRSVETGASLWQDGEAALRFAVIEEGIVAIRRVTASGETIVLGLFGPGDAIGLTAALGRATYPAEAVAYAPVSVCWIPSGSLRAALPMSPLLRDAVDRALLAHTEALREKIEIVSAGTVPRRLAMLFLHLSRRFGTRESAEAVTIGIGLTREQIGQLVGARTETVVRVLGRWQRAGWFDGSRTRIGITRMDMLARILGA